MNIEQLKALSLNIGHENLETSLIHYGQISQHAQGKIILAMGDQKDGRQKISEQKIAQLKAILDLGVL